MIFYFKIMINKYPYFAKKLTETTITQIYNNSVNVIKYNLNYKNNF